MSVHNTAEPAKQNNIAANAQHIQNSGEQTSVLTDNRPEAVAQRQLKDAINKSGSVQQLKVYQQMANTAMPAPVQRKENNTGLPDNLKSGIENLSGYSMDDVQVHYNSGKPAQLQAHAYAQGTEIHIAPGQEQHLPHEAWHVVQQKQGRVQPTMQMKGVVPVNDDAGLEKEADVMGVKAMNVTQMINNKPQSNAISYSGLATAIVQRSIDPTLPDLVTDKAGFRNIYNEHIIPEVRKTSKFSKTNKNVFEKLLSEIKTLYDENNIPLLVSTLKKLVLLCNTIQAEMDLDMEAEWHPTGGAAPQLEQALNAGERVFFHFTDATGFARISEAGVINDLRREETRKGSKGGVYIAPGNQTFNSEEAWMNLFLGQEMYAERGGYVFAFVLADMSNVSEGKPLTTGSPFKEVIHSGDIDFTANRLVYSGPNPFITGIS